MRAIASWSQTYGMTDEAMPTPIAARSTTGSAKARERRPAADRRRDDKRHQHRGGEAVDPAERRLPRDAVAEDDVEREERRVREREGEAERLGDEEHVGEEVDAGDRDDERESVARGPGTEGGERDHRQELDRSDRPERQPLDREVEAAVHDAERRAEGEDQPRLAASSSSQRAPRPAPEREDHRGCRDPQPGDAERLDARRTAGRRTPGRGSGRRRCRRSTSRVGRTSPQACPFGDRRHPDSVARRATVAPEPTEGVTTRMPANTRKIAASPTKAALLDEINCRLLEELQDDARLSMAELGRRVSLSAPGGRRTGAAARGCRSDHRLPGRGRPTGDRLPDRRHRPRAADARQLHKIPELAARRSPRSSSAIASPARTASRSSCTSARSTTSRRSSTSSCPYGRTTTSIMQSAPIPRRAADPTARPGRSRAPASRRSPRPWRPPAGTGARRRSPCCPRRPRPRRA